MSEPKDIFPDHKAGQPKDSPSGVNHLLVIAIDAYRHCPPLHNCVKDARDFMQVLWEKYTFEKSRTYTLINEQATRSNILNTIRDLKDKVKPQDNLLIYFSGHGQNINNVGYWIPVEVHPNDDSGFVATSDLKARLDNVPSFHTILLVDACFSGSLFLQFKNTPFAAGEDKRSRWGLAASHSREQALDGTPGENSPFADRLIRNLRNHQGKLRMQTLADRVIDEVYTVSEKRQTPIFKPLNIAGDDSGQFVFHPKIEDEDTAWSSTLQNLSIASLDAFIAKYPDGSHWAEANALRRDLEEESRWENLKSKGTVAQLTSFLLDFPNSRFREGVRLRIRELEEAHAWEEAILRNRISDFFDFIEKFPNSSRTAQAREKIAALQQASEDEDAWWKSKHEHSEIGYQRYLDGFPKGRYVSKAREALDELQRKKQEDSVLEKEVVAWNSACRLGTVSAFEAFLRDFPDGKFNVEAREKRDALNKEAILQRDRTAWAAAQQQHTLEAYQGYLAQGFTLYQREAQQVCTEIEVQKDEAAWQDAKSKNMHAGYRAYLDSGYTRYHSEATKALSQTTNNKRWIPLGLVILVLVVLGIAYFGGVFKNPEIVAFGKATEINSIPAWNEFINRFPNGENVETAKKRLEILDAKLESNLRDVQTLMDADEPQAASSLLDSVFRIKPDDPRIQQLRDKLNQ